jgi:hypothetical protein
MSDILSNDELNALAAEYVLGTLDSEERKGAAALLEVDYAFRGVVRIWERRLSELHLMVEPVEPDGAVWERIRQKVGNVARTQAPDLAGPPPEPETMSAELQPGASGPESGQVELGQAESGQVEPSQVEPGQVEPGQVEPGEPKPAKAESTEPKPPEDAVASVAESEARAVSLVPDDQLAPVVAPAPLPPLPPPRPPRTVRSRDVAAPAPIRTTGRGWKISTFVTTVVALGLVALIGAWRYFPDRLPEPLRANTLLKLPEPPPPPLPPPRREPPPSFDE